MQLHLHLPEKAAPECLHHWQQVRKCTTFNSAQLAVPMHHISTIWQIIVQGFQYLQWPLLWLHDGLYLLCPGAQQATKQAPELLPLQAAIHTTVDPLCNAGF